MMRIRHILFLISISLLSLTSCYSNKEIQVQLSPTLGLHREMNISAHPTSQIEASKTDDTHAKDLFLEEYIVTSFQHRPLEGAYQDWKGGRKDSAQFASDLKKYDDSYIFPSSMPKLDAESLFLFGRKKDGTYLLVVDANNNNSFGDDRVYQIERPVETTAKVDSRSSYPSILIRNLQGFYNGEVFNFSTTVDVRPTLLSVPNTSTKRLAVHLLSSQSHTGSFNYRGKPYKVAARSSMGAALLNTQRGISLKFADGKEDSAFLKQWNTRPAYKGNDTAIIGKHVFWIKRVSPLMKDVLLQPLRISPAQVKKKEIDPRMLAVTEMDFSRWEGKPYPSFSAKGDNELISNETLKGKIVFINFWFEACPPCIAEFEALSQMYDRLKAEKDFAFVSFTFESPAVIERVRKKFNLTFPIYAISREESERLNFGNGYPTNLILDKEGKVQFLYAGGETSKDAAKTFIDDNFYKRIIQGL